MLYELGGLQTVHIPITVESDGWIRFRYGGDIPKLRLGTIGVLVVPSSAVEDEEIERFLQKENDTMLRPERSVLLAEISTTSLHLPTVQPLTETLYWFEGTPYAKILLKEALKVRVRGTKKAELLDCRCEIPSLSDHEREAYSINHAYSLISQVFEPHRRSHSGNVFEKVLYEEDGKLKPLDSLREEAERQYKEDLCAFMHQARNRKQNG